MIWKFLLAAILFAGCGSFDEESTCVVEGCEEFKGDKGDTGNDGKKGDDGVAGPVGQPGSQGEVGATGAPGKDGTDGKDGVDGDDGKRGKKGKKGNKGDSCSVDKLSDELQAAVIACDGGSTELLAYELTLTSDRTWNPSTWLAADHTLAYAITFKVPAKLQIGYQRYTKTGTGWSYIETDDVRYCYQGTGNTNSNNAPVFKYAAEVVDFPGDCSTLWNQYGYHLTTIAGDWVETTDSLAMGVTGGTKTHGSSLATLELTVDLEIDLQ